MAELESLTQCPICRNPMEKGRILGDRYRLKWQPAAKKMILGLFASGSTPLGKARAFSRAQVDGFRCEHCRKIVVSY